MSASEMVSKIAGKTPTWQRKSLPHSQQGACPSGRIETGQQDSTQDIHRAGVGGLRSHAGPGGRTKAQLYNEARRRNLPGGRG